MPLESLVPVLSSALTQCSVSWLAKLWQFNLLCFVCIIFTSFLNLKCDRFAKQQMLLVLLLFAAWGGCRQWAEAAEGERLLLGFRQAVLTAACNTAIHKMWHSCWRDTAVSLFYSVIKTTSVRVLLLLAGSVGQSSRANVLYAGDRTSPTTCEPQTCV